MISCNEFCRLPTGESVNLYQIDNGKGEYVQFLDYGATIHAICVADRDGVIGDVVLGAPEGSDPAQSKIMGSIIGRCANRIAFGRYEADGKTHQLEVGRGGHFLHGASGNYAKKLFTGAIEGENSVVFSYLDEGAGGFDCCVAVQVKYTFDDNGVLTMETTMIPEGTTVLNPTNHAYFNLGAEDVRALELTLRASCRAHRDGENLPDGGKIAVAGTPADFTKPRLIGEAMGSDRGEYFTGKLPGYDEFYLLDQRPGVPAAVLYYPENGRKLTLETDMPSLVVYCDGGRGDCPGKGGQTYRGYCSVCLEPGFMPNAVNCPEYDSPIYRKGERLYSVTRYIFTTE